MRTSENGLKLIERFEGFVGHIYDDGTGVLTVGFGTTSADISPLPTTVTYAQAEQLLRRELQIKYEPAVNRARGNLNQNEFDALVSIAYNCGPGIVSTAYQLGRDLQAGNLAAVAADFGRYVYAGGRVLPGLVYRRHAEATLFLTPVAPPPPPPDPHHYDRFAPGEERSTVILYDRLRQHPHLHGRQLAGLEQTLTRLRKEVWRAACVDAHGRVLPPGQRHWADRNRGWRWQQLDGRAHGQKLA